MPQYPLPFAAPMPAYIDSQYVRTVLPMMESNLSPEICSRTPHGPTPLSPSSSTSEFRVSKAKKGKRVHACEFAGCTKLSTGDAMN
ncbi:C2H2 finger domain protein [Penicillium verhagenii]|uniref:C2H2 finger domain protein n=1 Tax=Penicillium verhagenii TaxID=1562060 RepID=UPI0025455BE8|nr:C2H2 finger domain protein [Penicillium verhagenii]KAJ5939225.1 C2H2 finger domain protein [Penicillium verhagenii]